MHTFIFSFNTCYFYNKFINFLFLLNFNILEDKNISVEKSKLKK